MRRTRDSLMILLDIVLDMQSVIDFQLVHLLTQISQTGVFYGKITAYEIFSIQIIYISRMFM